MRPPQALTLDMQVAKARRLIRMAQEWRGPAYAAAMAAIERAQGAWADFDKGGRARWYPESRTRAANEAAAEVENLDTIITEQEAILDDLLAPARELAGAVVAALTGEKELT